MKTIVDRSVRGARSGCAHVLFRAWPLTYGLERLMSSLNPSPPAGVVTRKLRGFPVRLTFDPGSYLGRFLYYRGMYEDATMRLLRRILRPGMTFVDVGANIGLHTTIAAHLVGPTGWVLAIEPQADLCSLIEANVRNNGLSNVTVIRTALGRTGGSAVLHQLYEANPGAATLRLHPGEEACTSAEVSVRTLSAVLEGLQLPPTEIVVKIDVEGAELEVLEGAEQYLARRAPAVVLIECVDHHLQRFGAGSLELLRKLASLGYRLSALHRGRRVDVVPSPRLNADVVAWRPDHCPW